MSKIDQPNTYTGITIGPIIRTLLDSRSTKAIWAASYLFSWIMKKLMDQIVAADESAEFLLPYRSGKVDDSLRAGLYPDRCVVKGDFSKLLANARTEILDELATKAAKNLSDRNQTQHQFTEYYEHTSLKEQIHHYLQDYLRIAFICTEVATCRRPVDELTTLLNSAELSTKLLTAADSNFLSHLLEDVFYNFLVKEKYHGDFKYFPSTAEIASYGFYGQPAYLEAQKILRDAEGLKNSGPKEEDAQIRFYKQLKNDPRKLYRNHHKYMAIVQADGDSFGQIIRAIEHVDNPVEAGQRFSIQLNVFLSEAVRAIQDWNAVPVYGSGDDLMFFAPVAKSPAGEGDTVPVIFDLITQIDELFADYVLKDPLLSKVVAHLRSAQQPVPSMSYGISITYYKYPLSESLQKAHFNLDQKAKKLPCKNAVFFRVATHSGQYFETGFRKNQIVFQHFKDLIRTMPNESILRSVSYKLESLAPLLHAIGTEKDDVDGGLFNLFKNHFDEDVHLRPDGSLTPYLQKVLKLLQEIYRLNPLAENSTQQNNDNIQQLYATLRFAAFIHNKEDRDDH